MQIRKLLMVLTIIALLATFIGCDKEPTNNNNAENLSYDSFLQQMNETSQIMAVAYLGNFTDMETNIFDYIKEYAPDFFNKYSFLTDIPNNNLVGDNIGEVYIIIPKDKNVSVTISHFGTNENGEDISKSLYQSDNGTPVILMCNTSWQPETQVKLTYADGSSDVWCPKLNDHGYISAMKNDNFEDMILDISPYSELLKSYYLNMSDQELSDFTLPTADDLIHTTWSNSEFLKNGNLAWYQITFNDTTSNIYWDIGDGEVHEYLNAPYEVCSANGFSVLSIDMGEFAGKLKYNILISSDGFSMYYSVDVSQGQILQTGEKQYRFLYQESIIVQ